MIRLFDKTLQNMVVIAFHGNLIFSSNDRISKLKDKLFILVAIIL
jgi:hypothetical protein